MQLVCRRKSSCPVALAALYVVLLLGGGSDKIQINSVDGFAPRPKKLSSSRATSSSASHNSCFTSRLNESSQDEEGENHPMLTTSRLSHAMLKVPSVDATAKYWTDMGGKIRISRPKEGAINGDDGLLSAFVELGFAQSSKGNKNAEDSDDKCFALELVSTDKESYSIGTCLSYIGVSMLLQFQNNLLGPITGETASEQPEEPNGISIQNSASAPGDFLCRFALKSKDLMASHDFYTSVLGMDAKAIDEKMLCLRYDTKDFPGVPTTLLFDATTAEIDMGDCLDHLAIATTCDIQSVYTRIEESEYNVFMKPTEMFGKQVMGVIDPNGYKVVIASE